VKIILILPVFLLSGCIFSKQPVPIAPKFPDATPELLKKCENLMTIEGDKIPITDLLKTVVNNYSLYYACSNKVEGWQEWYIKQKKNYDSIGNKQ
jgi:hypothetical protein